MMPMLGGRGQEAIAANRPTIDPRKYLTSCNRLLYTPMSTVAAGVGDSNDTDSREGTDWVCRGPLLGGSLEQAPPGRIFDKSVGVFTLASPAPTLGAPEPLVLKNMVAPLMFIIGDVSCAQRNSVGPRPLPKP